MTVLIISDFEEIQNCPVCTGELKGDTTKGKVVKVCRADRNHGYFEVTYGPDNEWYVEYHTYAP